MEGIESSAPIPRPSLRGLLKEAAKAVATLRYAPAVASELPISKPPRVLLPDPPSVDVVQVSATGFRGVRRLVNYRNADSADPPRACGPAALATLATHWGRGSAVANRGRSCLAAIAAQSPPSLLGLSPAQVANGAGAQGLTGGGWFAGEAALRQALDGEIPVIVLLDLHGLGLGQEMHWVVAHGYDDRHVYVSNWSGGLMPWADFRAATDTWRTRQLHTAGCALITWP